MEIIGRGFIAQHVAAIADRHPGVRLLAAGVSRTTTAGEADFRRERELLERAIEAGRRDGRQVVFLSTASSGVYAAEGCAGREEEAVPATRYARHKLSLERLLTGSGVDHLVLRLSHLVGAHQQPWQLVPSLVAQLRTGRVRLWREARRDLLDVRHMVWITDALLTAGVRGEVVNVASGHPVPVEEIVAHLAHRLGLSAEPEWVDRADPGVISVAKLHRLAPGVRGLGFGPDYFRGVLDARLAADHGVASGR
ncbi:NAD-dependent epimerase/dehydratase family protein [Kitasatospora sp. NPDC056446]|uniref:NAD-dependent epimerase/dehydratase family protein n=1 Tax=Kitasatospora sp. NPDC056446 TaxID=3345819 RepID=UPI00367B866E